MASYNKDELDSMRQDALRRMREMQKRAMPSGEDTGGGRPSSGPQGISGSRQNGPGSLLRGILPSAAGGGLGTAGIELDEEKAMILMLIYILFKQGADIKLLLALGYLLL